MSTDEGKMLASDKLLALEAAYEQLAQDTKIHQIKCNNLVHHLEERFDQLLQKKETVIVNQGALISKQSEMISELATRLAALENNHKATVVVLPEVQEKEAAKTKEEPPIEAAFRKAQEAVQARVKAVIAAIAAAMAEPENLDTMARRNIIKVDISKKIPWIELSKIELQVVEELERLYPNFHIKRGTGFNGGMYSYTIHRFNTKRERDSYYSNTTPVPWGF